MIELGQCCLFAALVLSAYGMAIGALGGVRKSLPLVRSAENAARGFDVLVWGLPFVGLGLGAVIVVVVVRRLQPRAQKPEVEQPPVEINEKYRQLLDEELSE